VRIKELSSLRQFYKYCKGVIDRPLSSLSYKVKSLTTQQKLGMKSLSLLSFYSTVRLYSVITFFDSFVIACKSLIDLSSIDPTLL